MLDAVDLVKSCNMNSHSQTTKTEPDPDAIKMFVGQVPRSMDENDLRKMFEDFGPIYQLNVLRDKVTGQSKGCCFITFYTRKAALDAQNELHNIKTMPGMQHPIQMKPADSEKRNGAFCIEDRKLFVGMLSKKCSENDVRMMFAPFGTIDDCTVLREQSGQSKGCAFITYANKQCATNAIKAMHHSQTMEGCRAPLVVKFADTQKEKEMKKLQQQVNANLLGLTNLSGLGSLGPQYLSLLQQAAAAGNVGALNNIGNLSGLNTLQMQQILSAAAQAAAAVGNNPGLAALASLTSGTPLNSNHGNATTVNPGVHNATSSTGEINNLQALQNLQGLAALASVANNPSLSNTLGVQNLAALNQLAQAASPTTITGVPGLTSSGSNVAASSSVANSTASTMGGLAGMQGSGLSSFSAISPAPSMNNINGLGGGSISANQNTSIDALTQAYSGIQQYAASFPNAFTTPSASAQLQQQSSSVNSAVQGRQVEATNSAQSGSLSVTTPAGKTLEGPDGANLFIYHLPQEFGDQDLMQTFMPFGNVISAKVFIDKQTNLSKCFGFVSYDNPVSGQAAIQAMNGFQIGMKRLKVQLKRPKSDSKPY